MPTKKDMEFAKLLIVKQVLSRSEVQNNLDIVDEMAKKGKNISLENLLIEEGILSVEEANRIQGPKKRVLHCSKCKTMYRIEEEDVGKKFKCKKCSMSCRPTPATR